MSGGQYADAVPDTTVLDDPVRSSLTGVHAKFAQTQGRVMRYQPDVSIFSAFPLDPTGADWDDAVTLFGRGGQMSFSGTAPELPSGWEIVMEIPGVQLTGHGVVGVADSEALTLGAPDVPEMLDLVGRTKPGPFLQRTVELGTYRGIRVDGRLAAMAGERTHPTGWTEISAVCTDPDYRGNGLASRLILDVAAGIVARGETPFLHTSADNANAIRLYEQLGFVLRTELTFGAVRVPH